MVRWGWSEAKQGIWFPYKIVQRKYLYEHCVLKQSVQGGKPWKLYVDDNFLLTSKVLKLLRNVQEK